MAPRAASAEREGAEFIQPAVVDPCAASARRAAPSRQRRHITQPLEAPEGGRAVCARCQHVRGMLPATALVNAALRVPQEE